MQRTITTVAPTALALAGIEIPESFDTPDEELMRLKAEKGIEGNTDRVVLYNPDAVGLWLYEKYKTMFSAAEEVSDKAVPRTSVMPSVTPVCFASMYSGVLPSVHGIQKYEKPVLKVDTLFDLFLRAGKKCAIVSTAGDSISKIFLERDMDYYIYPSLRQVNAKALKLIKEDTYDLIVIYNGNYDSVMHAKGPESKKALRALKQNIAFYEKLVNRIKSAWKGHTVFYGFCPDHGCHLIDGDRGSHGLDMPEDMNVIHFYGIEQL